MTNQNTGGPRQPPPAEDRARLPLQVQTALHLHDRSDEVPPLTPNDGQQETQPNIYTPGIWDWAPYNPPPGGGAQLPDPPSGPDLKKPPSKQTDKDLLALLKALLDALMNGLDGGGGLFRYNQTNNVLEYWDGTSWVELDQDASQFNVINQVMPAWSVYGDHAIALQGDTSLTLTWDGDGDLIWTPIDLPTSDPGGGRVWLSPT